jgi:hypothetical protein
MNGYYRSRSWGTVFARVIDLLTKDNMSPQRFLLLILITATTLMLAVVAPVAAVAPTREDIPFDEPITLSGVCPFDVEITPLTARETLTTFSDRNGNVVMQLTTGPLKVRVTNLATGESRTLNISGSGRTLIDEDRGTFTQEGPWLTLVDPGAFPEDPEFAGLFLTKGPVVSEIDPETGDFVRFISFPRQTENLCETLAS